MKKLGNFLVVVLLISVLSTNIAVAEEKKSTEPKKHKLLQRLIDEKNLEVHYLGHSYGLDGWALKGGEDGKTVQYVYTTPEGGLVLGLLFGPEGEIETTSQIRRMLGKMKEDKLASVTSSEKNNDKLDTTSNKNAKNTDIDTSQSLKNYREARKKIEEKYKETLKNKKSVKNKKSSKKSEKFYVETEKANWVALGNKNAPYIYIYMNPGCIHCKNYWNDIRNAVDKGNLQVRLIPFGKVDINRHAGAALLSVVDPKAAWDAYVKGNEKALDRSFAKKSAYKKIKKNTELFAKWGLPSSPFTVYHSPESGKIKIISGKPENTLLLLSEFLQ